MKVYTEIVHVDRNIALGQAFFGATEQSQETAWRILGAIRAGAAVLYGELEATTPDISLDTRIILGGSDRNVCCTIRQKYLQSKGFKDVTISLDLSFDMMEIARDWDTKHRMVDPPTSNSTDAPRQ